MADQNNRVFRLFGFEINRVNNTDQDPKVKSIVPPADESGEGYLTASGSHFGQYVNLDGIQANNVSALVQQYRVAASEPEVDDAIENIITEAISTSENDKSVELILDDVDTSESIKKKILEEFDYIYRLLNFNEYGYDIFKRWYVDGRIYHHLLVKEGQEKRGIVDIRPIDAAKMYKHRRVKEKIDPKTGAKIVDGIEEYFVYQDMVGNMQSTVKFTPDSISYVTSGLLNEDRKYVVSYLHKALKPINQLRMMEDSLVIYRLARAPERRIFYIDVGNLPRGKAEEYMKDIMSRYRNKIVYDAETGNLKDDRKHMSMLEDFWLPRREGGRGTEISTLPGGENLGQIDDILYFQRRVYNALNVPITRMSAEENPFQFGRTTEVSREEIQFQKFIDRLRSRFSQLFLGILKKHLILKNIITEQDWNDFYPYIRVDYARDNYFTELKEAEILRERMQTMEVMRDYIGTYFSREWAMRNVLRMNDEDIDTEIKRLEKEQEQQPEQPDEEE